MIENSKLWVLVNKFYALLWQSWIIMLDTAKVTKLMHDMAKKTCTSDGQIS
jgi:hypothetical protein